MLFSEIQETVIKQFKIVQVCNLTNPLSRGTFKEAHTYLKNKKHNKGYIHSINDRVKSLTTHKNGKRRHSIRAKRHAKQKLEALKGNTVHSSRQSAGDTSQHGLLVLKH